eukprot:NODE_133_length_18153_cov_0.298050.p11 type:complete len:149 gc:universal NODE_133_length_18153_cov_0.298050:12374-11928(-)
MSSYSKSQLDKFNVAVKVSSSLGLLGSVLVIWFFCRTNARRNYSNQCILMISIFEIIGCFGRLWGPDAFSNFTLCTIQAVLILTEVGASIWNIAHATNVLLRVIFGWNSFEAEKLRYLFIIASVLVPFVGNIFVISQNAIKPSGGIYC